MNPGIGRFLLLLPAIAALLVGVLSGLARLGIVVPVFAAMQAGSHGAFMVGAFFGTVIALERAVAIQRLPAYLGPLLSGSAGLIWLAGLPLGWGIILLMLAAFAFVLLCLQVCWQHRELHHGVMALAAGCWLAGNMLWFISGQPGLATGWWIAFLVLTIAGERLELTRYLPVSATARRGFLLVVALIPASLTLALWQEDAGLRAFGLALALLAAWLLRYDIARRTIKQQRLTRYIAVCLLSGYVWLALGGILAASGALLPGHVWRDAALHATLLGFVMAMVFGHAPIILPALARIALPWHPIFYLPLALLQLSLLVRLTGNLAGQFSVQQQGAYSTALSLLVFVLVVLTRIFQGRKP